MSSVHRNVTRTILNSTETTFKTSTPSADSLAIALTTSDALYVGYKLPFGSRYFHFGVLNVASVTVSVKYWDGSAWSAVEDLVDQTLGFTRSGFIAWQNQTDWAKQALSPLTDVELYWLKITVSGTLTGTATLQTVANIFADDQLLRAYYPELVSDTRYLPDSRNDFLEQYVAAKDLVVLRFEAGRLD
jgi:hypothetical protein